MLSIGLTGGIGSGKSTIAKVFRVLEIPVFEADAEGRRLLDGDTQVRTAVRERFGPSVFRDGKVDRTALAAVAFADKNALNDLNAIVHPAVHAAFATWARSQHASYVIMEAAILADTGGHKAFDRIIVVTAPDELRVQRVMQRDGVEEAAVRIRMANQVSEEARSAIADHIITNDDHQLVIPQVLAVHAALIKIADQ